MTNCTVHENLLRHLFLMYSCKVKSTIVILFFQKLKEFVCDVQSLATSQEHVQSQNIGATRGVKNITQVLSGIGLVSFLLQVFMKVSFGPPQTKKVKKVGLKESPTIQIY